MPDINDYGKFEGFYQPLPEKKEERREKEPETPPNRVNPFSLSMAKGTGSEEPG